MKYFVVYLLFINFIAFLVFGADKKRAKKKQWRIPEKTLFLLALLGGSAGAAFGMLFFRHKTKHAAFTIGIPLIILSQFILAYLLYLRLG